MEKAIFFEEIIHFAAPGEGVVPTLRRLRENGITGIQLSDEHLLQWGEEALRADLAAADMHTSVIHYFPRFLSDDPAVFEEAVTHSLRTMELCVRMGCHRLMVVPLPRSDVKGKEDLPRAQAGMIEGIRRIQAEADQRGIMLLFENFSTRMLPYGTVEDAESILAACPGVRYCFDSGNYHCTRHDVIAAFDRLASKTTMLHAKCFADSTVETSIRCDDGGYVYGIPYGEGAVQVPNILSVARAYDNIEIITVEHNALLKKEELQRSLDILNHYFP